MKQVFGGFGSQLSSLMRYCVKRIILKLIGKLQRLSKRPRVFACYHYSLTLRIVSVVSKIYRERRILLYPLLKSNYVGQNK